MGNIDPRTVEDFGREWAEFDQSTLDADGRRSSFEEYFENFPWGALPQGADRAADARRGPRAAGVLRAAVLVRRRFQGGRRLTAAAIETW